MSLNKRMNKSAYQSLVKENLEWLEAQPHSVVRNHIIQIVKWSTDALYPDLPSGPCTYQCACPRECCCAEPGGFMYHVSCPVHANPPEVYEFCEADTHWFTTEKRRL